MFCCIRQSLASKEEEELQKCEITTNSANKSKTASIRRPLAIVEKDSEEIIDETGVIMKLIPHQHTLFCERKERVCSSIGKLQEMELLEIAGTLSSKIISHVWLHSPKHHSKELITEDIIEKEYTIIEDSYNTKNYKLTIEDIDCNISCKYTWLDEDNIEKTNYIDKVMGPVLSGPARLLSLNIIGDNYVGGRAIAKSDYIGGYEGASEYWWMRILDGVRTELSIPKPININNLNDDILNDDDPRVYKLTKDDLGANLKVKCRPIRCDGYRGEIVTSLPSKDIVDPYLEFGGTYSGDSKDVDEFKYITFNELPNFGSKHKSLMSKHLTTVLFEKLKKLNTSKGYTLSNAIMTGVVTPHLGVGITAGDEESWDTFKELYYPIIKDWHGGYDAYTQKHPVDLDYSKLVFTDEQKEFFNEYVVSTRIRAARNISGYSLPSGASIEDRSSVESVLKSAFAGLEGELKGTYYKLGSLTEDQTKFLLDKGFLFQIPTAKNLLTGAGAARSWPNNRGIFHNEAQTALAWVNEEDHCRIISMENGGDIPSVFKRFCELSNAVKISAEAVGATLMWNETLGFLGTCPSNLGTGLRASVMVVLPSFNALMEGGDQEDKELLEYVCASFDLQPRGSAGEHSPAVGGKFDVSNKQRIGYSEVELVQKMINGVGKVIELEKLLAAGSSSSDIRKMI
jgi:creatine kinase